MAVALGDDFTVAVGESGKLFVFGNNIEELTKEIENLAPVRLVAAGAHHIAIVTEAGDLFMCGNGDDGQLGLGDKENQTTPTRVARKYFENQAVLMAACGQKHTIVATEGGDVYTFGCGLHGRLGHGDNQQQLMPKKGAVHRAR